MAQFEPLGGIWLQISSTQAHVRLSTGVYEPALVVHNFSPGSGNGVVGSLTLLGFAGRRWFHPEPAAPE